MTLNVYAINQPFLIGLINKLEYAEVIDTASKLTAKAYSYNRKKDVEGISTTIVAILGLSTILLFSYFFLLYYGIRDNNEQARIAGFFFLGISVFLTSVIGCMNFF